jgi:hypothetical protein
MVKHEDPFVGKMFAQLGPCLRRVPHHDHTGKRTRL